MGIRVKPTGSSIMPQVKATIAIPTYNGEIFLESVLKACLDQKTDFKYEILVIDSGSSDKTLEIVKAYKKVKLHQIPNKEFGHGKTRNLAAKLAKGEIIVFLTQDATPASRDWINQMLMPFEFSDNIVCVFGKQIPRPDCMPITKRDVMAVFSGFGPDHFFSIQSNNPIIKDNQAAMDANTFFSDVNSAIRRSLLIDKIPFRNVSYSEDQALGKDVIRAGLLKAYSPLGAVVHSHTYSPVNYFRRMVDETTGLIKTGHKLNKLSFISVIKSTIKGSLLDTKYILFRDKDYALANKIKWLLLTPFYNIARYSGIRLAINRQKTKNSSKYSLEAAVRNTDKTK